MQKLELLYFLLLVFTLLVGIVEIRTFLLIRRRLKRLEKLKKFILNPSRNNKT